MFSDKRQKTRWSPDFNLCLPLNLSHSLSDDADSSISSDDYFRQGLIFPNHYGSSGKAVFTALQLQELERQKLIHNYITSSLTVPPHLLSGFESSGSRNPGGSDPEPWRCKRTDGKKWRCSRDVAAPDQKYCDRHAHKSKTRSRKHVEINSHTPLINNNNNNNNKSPSPVLAPLHEQPKPRCVEWEWGQALVQTSSASSSWIPVEEEEGDESGGMTKIPVWMNGHGGPLGEALCLGNGRGTCGGWNSKVGGDDR